MKLLITGGTGFIGSRLALGSVQSGHQVRVLGQSNTPAESENLRALETQSVELVVASITDTEAVANAVAGIDIIFHLAAAQHEMNVPDDHFRRVNVEGTRTILDAAVRAGVRRFVHGSTIGVYGALNGVIDEDSPTRPDNIYGRTKLEGERLVVSYRERLHVVVVRIPEVYGPGDRRLVKLFRAIDRNLFFVIGKGQNLHHPIYIDDLIAGLWAAAERPEAMGQVFLLAGKEPVTTNQMIAEVAAALERPKPWIRAPMPVFLGLAALMELTLRPLGIQPPLHRRRLDFFRKSFELSGLRAGRLLGFAPQVGFAEGARRTAAWYHERGYLEKWMR